MKMDLVKNKTIFAKRIFHERYIEITTDFTLIEGLQELRPHKFYM